MTKLRAKRWTKFRNYKATMDKLVIPAFRVTVKKESEKLEQCATFVYAVECTNCNTKHFAGHNRCRSRWCLNCNYLRSLTWLAKLLPLLEDWLEKGNYICMLNFTITDTDKLSDGIKILQQSFRNIYNSTAKKRARWIGRFPGGLRSLEVTVGKNSKKWHPHLHCLVLQDTYAKDAHWLMEEWKQAVGQYHPNGQGSIWIKEIKANDTKMTLVTAICETIKYILKPNDKLYQADKNGKYNRLHEAYYALKGKRQINTWGLLRKLDREVEEELDNQDEKKLTEFICQRCGCTEYELKTLLYTAIMDDILLDVN